MQTNKLIIFLILFLLYLPLQIFLNLSIIKIAPELFIIVSILILRKFKLLKINFYIGALMFVYLFMFTLSLYYYTSSFAVSYSISRFYILPILFYFILYNENIDFEFLKNKIVFLSKIIILIALIEFFMINFLNMTELLQSIYVNFEEKMRYDDLFGYYKVLFPLYHSQHTSLFFLLVFVYFWYFNTKDILWRYLSLLSFVFTITGTSLFSYLIVKLFFLVPKSKYRKIKLLSLSIFLLILLINIDYILYLKSGYTTLNYQGEDVSIGMYYLHMFILHYLDTFLANLSILFNLDFALYMFNYNDLISYGKVEELLVVKQSEVHLIKMTLILGIVYILLFLFILWNGIKTTKNNFIKIFLSVMILSMLHYNSIQVWFYIFATVITLVYVHKNNTRKKYEIIS